MNHKKLKIITIADLTWQNGIEYAVEGVRRARDIGVNLSYTIIGDGPLLEAVAFAIHDSQLSNCCRLVRNLNRRKFKIVPDIVLVPAVAPGYKLNRKLMNNSLIHWIMTSVISEETLITKSKNHTIVPRWDSQSIADVLISIYQRII